MDIFNEMEAPELRKYIEFLLWHYRVVDAFWFIYVAERFDQPTAERINEKVWDRVSRMAAKDLTSRFQIKEKGLKGFVNAQRFFPWCILVGYEIQASVDEQESLILGIASGSLKREDLVKWLSGHLILVRE